jgi:hypothetical protein
MITPSIEPGAVQTSLTGGVWIAPRWCRSSSWARRARCNASLRRGPGRPGKSPEQAALEDALAEIDRLRETIAEQAIELHLFRGKERWG